MKPFSTPCIGCGRDRFTGWVLERGRGYYRLPMCSRCIQGLLAKMINPWKPVPNKLQIRYFRKLWQVKQEPRP